MIKKLDNKDLIIILLSAVCMYLFFSKRNVYEGYLDPTISDEEADIIYAIDETGDVPDNFDELLDKAFAVEDPVVEEETTAEAGNARNTGNARNQSR